jgi:hypothetical protein
MDKKLQETEIVVVLDKSGSMREIQESTVKGFNNFLYEQKNSEGNAFFTLVQFDDRYEINYQSIPVNDVPDLILGETFVPRGTTALLDAIGKTIEELKTDRDVVFVIITDGEENSSKVYKREAIMKMIETQTNDGWNFLFLAANQDAIKSGRSIGITGNKSMSYSSNDLSVDSAFNSVSSNLSQYRKSKIDYKHEDFSKLSNDLDFKDDQRKKSK